MKAMTAVFLLFLSQGVFAGGSVGNGGDAVVCFKTASTRDQVKTILESNQTATSPIDPFDDHAFPGRLDEITGVRLLDLIELGSKYQPTVAELKMYSSDQPPGMRDARPQLLATSKISNIADFIGSGYGKELLQFKDVMSSPDTWSPQTSGVVAISDFHTLINVSPNCLIVQIAYQEPLQNSVRILYDSRLYQKLRGDHQAALRLHEWIYYDYFLHMRRDHPEVVRIYSDSVRQLVGWLFTDRVRGPSPQEFNAMVDKLDLWRSPLKIDDSTDGSFSKIPSVLPDQSFCEPQPDGRWLLSAKHLMAFILFKSGLIDVCDGPGDIYANCIARSLKIWSGSDVFNMRRRGEKVDASVLIYPEVAIMLRGFVANAESSGLYKFNLLRKPTPEEIQRHEYLRPEYTDSLPIPPNWFLWSEPANSLVEVECVKH